MKSLLKQFVAATAHHPVAWPVYRACGLLSSSLGKIHGHALFARKQAAEDEMLAKVLREVVPDLTVASGPFQGMRYPAAQSVGSALLPKLLGSYESELHGTLEGMLAANYESIVDIGCAEGYYAVGLALRFPHAQIYAFDTDAKARVACSEMARLNGVAARVHVGEFCDETLLASIPLGERALIISDCEGYESALFTERLAQRLAAHDVLVETHDFIDIEISSRVRSAFAKTHSIKSIKTLDDIGRAHAYQCPELQNYPTSARRAILSERRPAIMEWLVMTPEAVACDAYTETLSLAR
jgi:precorrin-6B methylase 2